MSRRLSPEEAALWARVAAGIAAEPHAARRPLPVRQSTDVEPERRHRAPGATLDASWDRRLRLGEVEPDRVIDLHGLALAAAHARTLRAVADAVKAGHRLIVFVTGKPPAREASRLDLPLRGIIRASIDDWLAASPHAGHIAAVRSASRRHGGTGALYVILRRRR